MAPQKFQGAPSSPFWGNEHQDVQQVVAASEEHIKAADLKHRKDLAGAAGILLTSVGSFAQAFPSALYAYEACKLKAGPDANPVDCPANIIAATATLACLLGAAAAIYKYWLSHRIRDQRFQKVFDTLATKLELEPQEEVPAELKNFKKLYSGKKTQAAKREYIRGALTHRAVQPSPFEIAKHG